MRPASTLPIGSCPACDLSHPLSLLPYRKRRSTAPITIRAAHLAAALAGARPSVPEPERDRLEAIYAQFQAAREPGGGASAADKGKGKRVSWA